MAPPVPPPMLAQTWLPKALNAVYLSVLCEKVYFTVRERTVQQLIEISLISLSLNVISPWRFQLHWSPQVLLKTEQAEQRMQWPDYLRTTQEEMYCLGNTYKPQGVFSRQLLQLMKTLHFTQEYMKAVSRDELTLLIDISMTYLLCPRLPENVISIRLLCCWKSYSYTTIQVTGACLVTASPSKAQSMTKPCLRIPACIQNMTDS